LPGERGDDLDYLSLRFDAMAQRITAQVSHDLRTPLAAVQGYLETLSLKQDSLDLDQRRRFLAIALGETRRLGQLVDELFELAALDAREKQPNPEGFMMAERVLDNLISNAISHSPAGTKVRVSVAADANGVSIHVSDSGSGIDEQALAHIFTPFYQAPGANRSGHAGLGLAIARRMAELQQGHITVHNRPVGGAEFLFWLPLADEKQSTPL